MRRPRTLTLSAISGVNMLETQSFRERVASEKLEESPSKYMPTSRESSQGLMTLTLRPLINLPKEKSTKTTSISEIT